MECTNYRDTIKIENAGFELPVGLISHLKAQEFNDINVNYQLPHISEPAKEYCEKTARPLDPKNVRLPARINSPLIPYPPELKGFITQDAEIDKNKYQASHIHQLEILINVRKDLITSNTVFNCPISFDVPSLKKIVKNNYSSRYQLINFAAMEFAKRMTSAELSLCAMEDINYQSSNSPASPYLSFLISMQRMRVLICAYEHSNLHDKFVPESATTDANLKMYSNGLYTYVCLNPGNTYAILVAGNHFMMFHSSTSLWFSGNFTYLDYALTTADTVNNLEILAGEPSYSWASAFFKQIIELAEDHAQHNAIVDFMKSFEGFMLNLSDYDESHAMSWIPLMEASFTLWELDMKIINESYPFSTIPALLHNPNTHFNKRSYLCKIIHLCSKLTKTEIQELSSLHKFVFYAEVDAEAGVKKFLKRVHTSRPMDNESVGSLVRLAKCKFLQSYAKKHKCVPTLRGNEQKSVLIRMHYSRGELHKVNEYPLTWWDDIVIWNCMDNTLTEDALEFAKDKGALKSEIRHGPGDSRKELLQVIEQPDYKLKTLIPPGGFVRSKVNVYRTCSSKDPVKYDYPVRLIEKEREQKIEARLFANAELSNKHALSVIATKMKKALSYFDEQLMTPSDSSRKELLHTNAQLLLDKDNYSILMDIEGHNQSMQFENTYGLCQFMGEIFGESDWKSIPNYFGASHIYHYDEYEDKVLVSEGQLGGIEGWLNPLWTLHTTLMMQLLRYMTDLEIPSIMVYSDDVNSIIHMPQCTESTIQATFVKIMNHCIKFGMVAKMSQTNLSKHRATMLRQHYFKGVKADSTLKRLMSVSGVNNPMIMSEELEVAGICSSASSALESSNHHEACCFLKNYKLGVLLARYPHILLSKPREAGCLSSSSLPVSLANLLYNVKDHTDLLKPENFSETYKAAVNDVSRYLNRHKKATEGSINVLGLDAVFGFTMKEERFADHADRMLYLQIYDEFLMDLLFFIIYMPANLGGLGGILHINMSLSGHSVGMSKSLHYIHQWITKRASNKSYFFTFMENALSRKVSAFELNDSVPVITTSWPSEKIITTCVTSLSSSIASMIKHRTKNKNVLKLIELASKSENFGLHLLNIFKDNFHERIVQFYYENSSVHFFDLLINKIETSSGLLSFVKNLAGLRKSMVGRAMINIRIASERREHVYGAITPSTDIVSYLVARRSLDYPNIKFIEVAEILYDNNLQECDSREALISVRKTSPQYFLNGIQVYNDPRFGDDVLYKGEVLDNERMMGNKEELLAAKVCSVTKWLLSKHSLLSLSPSDIQTLDCVKAANLCLKTLTGQLFSDLMKFCPDETGGEILHRIPNMRFSTKSYIRTELNEGLKFVAELTQKVINDNALIDSNINFEYVRMRLILAALVRNKFEKNKSLIMRYNFKHFNGIVDVQFVTPKIASYIPDMEISPYSVFRNHKFSEFRFRFLSATYLNATEMTDLSLVPNRDIFEEYLSHGKALMRDIVYKYAVSLDKEYMITNFKYPPRDAWKPIYRRLEQIDISMQDLTDSEKYIRSIGLLEEELSNRGKFYITKKRDKLEAELQTECLNALYEQSPISSLHSALIERFATTIKKDIRDNLLTKRIENFKEIVEKEVRYRRKFAIHIVAEIILSMHFICVTSNGLIRFDQNASMRQLQNTGVFLAIIMNVNPELYAKIQLIGPPIVQEAIDSHNDEVIQLLTDISMGTQFSDMSMPTLHLSAPESRKLDKGHQRPEVADLIEYTSIKLTNSAMNTLGELGPLMDYAEKCCQYASSPYVWESPTGSDNYCSQYGLFRMLKRDFDITEDISICNLTAGRGDGQYALDDLGLNSTAFSRPDDFTTLHHHPHIIFKKDYDLFRTDTLLFVNDYDFIHIDVSFLGQKSNDLTDCILLLESQSLSYCIRLNSITLGRYKESVKQLSIIYDHHLAYSSSNVYKTHEIYLIGVPSDTMSEDDGKSLKQTAAFRAMALSFTQLMKHPYRQQMLMRSCINSITETLPAEGDLTGLIKAICDKTIVDERKYYLQRFKDQYESSSIIYLSSEHMHPTLKTLFDREVLQYEIIRKGVYLTFDADDIGHVKKNILRYHERHLLDLQNDSKDIYKVELGRQHVLFMTKLRQLHPLYSVRGLCNVLLGIAKIAPDVTEYTSEEIDRAMVKGDAWSHLKSTKHQNDTSTAIKLLVLSTYYGDSALGLKYCSVMGIKGFRTSSELMRVRFRYKQLSWLMDVMREMVRDGRISLDSIHVMESELMTRKIQQSIQVKKYTHVPTSIEQADVGIDFDENTLMSLFGDMELFATRNELHTNGFDELLTTNHEPLGKQIVDITQHFEDAFEGINFDIGIEQTIDSAIERLGLELDPATGRYKGFEIQEYDEYDSDDEL